MPYLRWQRLTSLVASAGLLLGSFAPTLAAQPVTAPAPVTAASNDTPPAAPATDAAYSHRLIVELKSPSLALWASAQTSQNAPHAASLWNAEGLLNVQAPAAQAYVAQLKAEQAAFVSTLRTTLPSASVDYLVNEFGAQEPEMYQIVFNGLTIDPGTDQRTAMRQLLALPEVKQVYFDYAHQPDLYTSTALINAPTLWTALGGQDNAGAGIRLASMDGGVHKDAPMFDGTGYSYPPGYPAGGLGYTANNNGKIIASRVYFRSWDPPSAGDENPWPGTQGTSHGVHTASTAAGGWVDDAVYNTVPLPPMSGVAPKAWLMSYRVFYNSVTNNGSFYNAEGIAALEDIVADGAQVVNNSWGGGPGSTGGVADALDTALINAANAGVFVSMSNGNSGPGLGTGDHPSAAYINVAASTTSGTFAAGLVGVSAPQPLSPTLQGWGFGTATFGQPLLIGSVYTFTFVPGEVISPTNFEGCNPWPAGAFTGKTAVIRRGTCEFGVKALNAQNAGATSVVIYNQAVNGNTLTTMGPGAVGAGVTISAILVGNTLGNGMVTWYNTYTDASRLTLNYVPFQLGNTPDYIASFSSRGPGMGNVLKPDVAAPGVNIMAQGYKDNAVGEERHLGYGQVSGTSMASPHVAGTAALLRQMYPTWSNAAIKSALMSTSKYWYIYRQEDGRAAQPLDMGAGRIDLAKAMDPGVILNPPSLSFGLVPTGTPTSLSYWVTNITNSAEMYTLTTLYTGAGYTATTALPGVTVSPTMLMLAAGAGATVTVTFDPAMGMGWGDNQGYIVMDGDWHDAHLPLWARVTPVAAPADVLIIDNDGSASVGGANYLGTYTATLTALGYTYTIFDADANYGVGVKRTIIPDLATLSGYKAIIYYTGNNFRPSGAVAGFTLPLTSEDMYRLNEYATNGGTIIAMGQDLASVTTGNTTSPHFFYDTTLGSEYLRDSVSANALPTLPVVPVAGQPSAFAGLTLDLSGPSTWSGGLMLSGLNEVPPVTTTMQGWITATYDVATRYLNLSINITSTDPFTLTGGHIHSGTVGNNGPVVINLNPSGANLTSYTQNAIVQLDATNAARLTSGRLYVNYHTENYPGGEVRAQLLLTANKDGAANQLYIDEIKPSNFDTDGSLSPDYAMVFRYSGGGAVENNYVSMAHREQPTLEEPETSFWGATFYTTFGLEGVNGATTRQTLLQRILNWAWDRPTVALTQTTVVTNSSGLATFVAGYTPSIAGATPVSYRWDFGDDSAYEDTNTSPNASHYYATCGTYRVRVEVVDSYGNHSIGWSDVNVTNCAPIPMYNLYVPYVRKP